MITLEPDSSSPLALVLVVIVLFLYAFVTYAETVLRTYPRSQLFADKHRSLATHLRDHPLHASLAFAAVRLPLLMVAFVALMPSAARLPWSPWAFFGVIMLVFLAVGHILPATLARHISPRNADIIFYLIQGLLWLSKPILAFYERLLGLEPQPESEEDPQINILSDDEIRILATIVGETEAVEGLPEDERRMIERILDLDKTNVREVMTPRIHIVALPETATLADAIALILEEGHSRIPIYRDNIDNIVGLLYAKDLFKPLQTGHLHCTIAESGILRQPLFVPESKKLDRLLKEMQQQHMHLAVVVDEYGGTAGIATIEDIMEEIVGDIQDEYDEEAPEIEHLSPTELLCHAHADIDHINSILNVALPTDTSDTIGGLLYALLGDIPEVGHEEIIDGARLRVVERDERRITKVHVQKLPPDASLEEEETPATTRDKPSTSAEKTPPQNTSMHYGFDTIG